MVSLRGCCDSCPGCPQLGLLPGLTITSLAPQDLTAPTPLSREKDPATLPTAMPSYYGPSYGTTTSFLSIFTTDKIL